VIYEAQSQDAGQSRFLKLLERLLDRQLHKGDFLDEWDLIERAERQTPQSAPQPQKQTQPQIQPPKQTQPELPSSITENLNGVELAMILVPGGKFKMGSPEGEGNDNERPQHDATVPSFYIGKYQVTQEQWQAVMGNNPSVFKGDNLPVENVSWNDAREFCKKLSQITGKEYRLPSEAEWEYACRAGTTGDYAGKLDEMAWYEDNSEKKTHPVGLKKPNAFGLYDMHGNVWEWCEDVWHKNYDGAPIDGSAWVSGGDSNRRRLRGGSWHYVAFLCRSACRLNLHPGNRGSSLGFRVVVSVARTP
jgi:formylglycine-generating enzyme required for sulfatase activity